MLRNRQRWRFTAGDVAIVGTVGASLCIIGICWYIMIFQRFNEKALLVGGLFALASSCMILLLVPYIDGKNHRGLL